MKLEIIDASFAYNGKINIFDKINFSIKEGEILSILGPNGTGKTTLLKCLLGIKKLKNGEIRVESDKADDLINIGYVPQSFKSSFPYQVIEMVLMGRAKFVGTFSAPKLYDLKIAEESLKAIGIYELKNRIFSELSGGEKQLVLIARSLAAESRVLILDEPTSALDFRNQYKTLELLCELTQEEGLSVIMTTHQPEHALRVSDKVLLMGENRENYFGKTYDILTEENLTRIYGIKTKIVDISGSGGNLRTVIPGINKKKKLS